MKKIIFGLLFVLAFININAFAGGNHWDVGDITNITAHRTYGVAIMTDTGKPPTCSSSAGGNWLNIKPEDEHILAVILSAYHAGQIRGTYFVEVDSGNNRCYINQWDPVE